MLSTIRLVYDGEEADTATFSLNVAVQRLSTEFSGTVRILLEQSLLETRLKNLIPCIVTAGIRPRQRRSTAWKTGSGMRQRCVQNGNHSQSVSERVPTLIPSLQVTLIFHKLQPSGQRMRHWPWESLAREGPTPKRTYDNE